MKKFKGKIFYMVLGAILLTTITVIGDTIINSSAVEYDNSGGNTEETTVEGALNELYTMVSNQSSGGMTISFVSHGGNNLETIDSIIVVPELPVPTRSGYYFVGWYDAEEGGNEIKEGSVISANITLHAHWEQTISFSTDSWSKIKWVLRQNRNAYEVGSTKTVTMNLEGSNKDYVLRLANTSRPDVCDNADLYGNLTYSQSACGVVIEFVTTIGTHVMNSGQSNGGGWAATEMRSYLNTDGGSIYSKLPDDLKSVIITTEPIVSGSGSGNRGTLGASPNTIGDKLYLFSGKEVAIDWSSDRKRNTSTDTRTLDYYSDCGTSEECAKRKKYTTATGTTATEWWLRTAKSQDYESFLICYAYSSYSYARSDVSYGVAPAFRILE